ncbi:hypothetical protein NC652_033454 [Populus alba x Populus x berolinensis]|nr:hypothetical protein NC652_033454 [Populus alba x Populus x berolinensis]
MDLDQALGPALADLEKENTQRSRVIRDSNPNREPKNWPCTVPDFRVTRFELSKNDRWKGVCVASNPNSIASLRTESCINGVFTALASEDGSKGMNTTNQSVYAAPNKHQSNIITSTQLDKLIISSVGQETTSDQQAEKKLWI